MDTESSRSPDESSCESKGEADFFEDVIEFGRKAIKLHHSKPRQHKIDLKSATIFPREYLSSREWRDLASACNKRKKSGKPNKNDAKEYFKTYIVIQKDVDAFKQHLSTIKEMESDGSIFYGHSTEVYSKAVFLANKKARNQLFLAIRQRLFSKGNRRCNSSMFTNAQNIQDKLKQFLTSNGLEFKKPDHVGDLSIYNAVMNFDLDLLFNKGVFEDTIYGLEINYSKYYWKSLHCGYTVQAMLLEMYPTRFDLATQLLDMYTDALKTAKTKNKSAALIIKELQDNLESHKKDYTRGNVKNTERAITPKVPYFRYESESLSPHDVEESEDKSVDKDAKEIICIHTEPNCSTISERMAAYKKDQEELKRIRNKLSTIDTQDALPTLKRKRVVNTTTQSTINKKQKRAPKIDMPATSTNIVDSMQVDTTLAPHTTNQETNIIDLPAMPPLIQPKIPQTVNKSPARFEPMLLPKSQNKTPLPPLTLPTLSPPSIQQVIPEPESRVTEIQQMTEVQQISLTTLNGDSSSEELPEDFKDIGEDYVMIVSFSKKLLL